MLFRVKEVPIASTRTRCITIGGEDVDSSEQVGDASSRRDVGTFELLSDAMPLEWAGALDWTTGNPQSR